MMKRVQTTIMQPQHNTIMRRVRTNLGFNVGGKVENFENVKWGRALTMRKIIRIINIDNHNFNVAFR